MERLRLAVKKDGALQFLSHLDFARAVRYVIIRAKLPICYSEGFNPHMKLSFASALASVSRPMWNTSTWNWPKNCPSPTSWRA